MYGCGGKTFVNFLLKIAKRENIFNDITYYDLSIVDEDIVSLVKKDIVGRKKQLVILRMFESVDGKQEVLEKLNSLRQPNPQNLTYLVVTNHLSIVKPEEFFALTSQFFSDHLYIEPFSKKETLVMTEINNKFYGWDIKENLLEEIYQFTGGVPRLIKHVEKEIEEKGINFDRPESFFKNPSILYQLKYFVKLLITVESKKLKELRLVDNDGKINSGILRVYFERYISDTIEQLYPNLSSLEQKILTYLLESNGDIVSIDKIGDLMEASGLEYSPWAIYKHISRIKPKISKHYRINNVKGKGYILEKTLLT
jgi:biotin operon repressor